MTDAENADGVRARARAWPLALLAVSACGYPSLERLDALFLSVDGPSCAGLPRTCGEGATQSCCRAQLVLGGTYNRSNDSAAPATVSTFVLDNFEVTVGRFRAFVNAGLGTQQGGSHPATGAGAHPRLDGSGWDMAWNGNLAVDTNALVAGVKCNASFQTWTDAPGLNENKAMNCVTWYEAMAFCIWDGGYLPTEAEWNYAASGGAEQRVLPWSKPATSTTIDCTYANYKNDGTSDPPKFCVGASGGVNRAGSESVKGDGLYGHSDLAGNVLEWVLDWTGSYPMPCDDCATLTPDVDRVIRGGSFSQIATGLRSSRRDVSAPSARNSIIGWRCARTKPGAPAGPP